MGEQLEVKKIKAEINELWNVNKTNTRITEERLETLRLTVLGMSVQLDIMLGQIETLNRALSGKIII